MSKSFLREILFLPSAIAGFLIVGYVLDIFWTIDGGWVYPFFQSLLLTGVFVFVGALVVPSNRLVISMVLFALVAYFQYAALFLLPWSDSWDLSTSMRLLAIVLVGLLAWFYFKKYNNS